MDKFQILVDELCPVGDGAFRFMTNESTGDIDEEGVATESDVGSLLDPGGASDLPD